VATVAAKTSTTMPEEAVVVLVAKEATVPGCDSSLLAAMDILGMVVMAVEEVGVAGCDSSLLAVINVKITIFLNKEAEAEVEAEAEDGILRPIMAGERGGVSLRVLPPPKKTYSLH
jgi:hypothetical protein